jgi:hypothetical protein
MRGDMREGLRGEHAHRGHSDVLEDTPNRPLGGEQRPAIVAVVVMRKVLAVAPEALGHADGATSGVTYAGRDDERVRRVRVQRDVRPEAQLARGRVPHDVVDAHDGVRRNLHGRRVEALVVPLPYRRVPRERVAEIQQENRARRHAGGIDLAVERHRHPGLEVEPVEVVEDRAVLTFGRIRSAVTRHRQNHPPRGVLIGIGHREAVRRKRASVRRAQVEERCDRAGPLTIGEGRDEGQK